MSGQVLSAILAWSIAVSLFFAALRVVYLRRDVAWQPFLVFIIGAFLLAVAGGMAATNAVHDPDGTLPPPLLALIVACRATSAAIFLGLVIMLSGRPRWLIRLVSRWF